MTVPLQLLESGWITVIALAILWAEIAVLSMMSNAPAARFRLLLPNTLSGSFLLAALGLALADGSVFAIAALLGGSFISHAVDVVYRLTGHASGLRRRTE